MVQSGFGALDHINIGPSGLQCKKTSTLKRKYKLAIETAKGQARVTFVLGSIWLIRIIVCTYYFP